MPAIVFDIVAVRDRKAALLRADHELLVEQLAALRGTGQHGKVRVLKAALEKVRLLAESEGVDLGGAPIVEATMSKNLTSEGVLAIWQLLSAGKSQQETARIVGISREVVSKLARRASYYEVTKDLPHLPAQGRWRSHAANQN